MPNNLCPVCLHPVEVDEDGNNLGTCDYSDCPIEVSFDSDTYKPLDFNEEYDREYESEDH